MIRPLRIKHVLKFVSGHIEVHGLGTRSFLLHWSLRAKLQSGEIVLILCVMAHSARAQHQIEFMASEISCEEEHTLLKIIEMSKMY
jgi:hypothetical protein